MSLNIAIVLRNHNRDYICFMNSDRMSKLKELLNKDPNSSFLLFALAKEYEAISESFKAIHTYEQLLMHNPNYTGAYYHLAKQYELVLEIKNAIDTYEKGILICIQQKATHDASELRGALEMITMDDPDRV